jgi:SM-20-related protein
MQLINPDLDRIKITQEYNDTGCVTIENILQPQVAEDLYECITAKDFPWLFHRSGHDEDVSVESLAKMSEEDVRALIPKRAHSYNARFSSAFLHYPHADNPTASGSPQGLKDFFSDLSNRSNYIDFFRDFNELGKVERLSMIPSCYTSGHYLSTHNDATPHGQPLRIAAHVMCLTKSWGEDWGGRFTFCDNWGRVIDDKMPSFNSLSVFKVPKAHYVSEVSALATKGRYSLYGWFS